jgi:hypothetical protein
MPELWGPAAGQWRALEPRDAAAMLAPVTVPWWIAGGWALDLFVGTQTRQHKDLDVGIARSSAPAVLSALGDWEFFEAKDGALYRPDAVPRAQVNCLWGRPLGERDWSLELLLEEVEQDEWVYRRARSIRVALARALRRDASGLNYLAPELQLIYKARSAREEDQADYARVLPLLDRNARDWLEQALETAHPEPHTRGA